MFKAPYDAKNETDYQKITDNILAALKQIEHNPKEPATQANLAKLAKCSRGVLRLRGWPIEKLKGIKKKRKAAAIGKTAGEITVDHKDPVEIHLEDKRLLLEQLDKSRTECAKWTVKYKELESEKNKLHRSNEVLQKENSSLKERNSELERGKADLKKSLEQKRAKDVVIPFKARNTPKKRR